MLRWERQVHAPASCQMTGLSHLAAALAPPAAAPGRCDGQDRLRWWVPAASSEKALLRLLRVHDGRFVSTRPPPPSRRTEGGHRNGSWRAEQHGLALFSGYFYLMEGARGWRRGIWKTPEVASWWERREGQHQHQHQQQWYRHHHQQSSGPPEGSLRCRRLLRRRQGKAAKARRSRETADERGTRDEGEQREERKQDEVAPFGRRQERQERIQAAKERCHDIPFPQA